MIQQAIVKKDGEFTVAELERNCPGVSLDMIRTVLKNMQDEKQVKCVRKGRGAKWMRIN